LLASPLKNLVRDLWALAEDGANLARSWKEGELQP